jgi:hypothetical protein
VGLLASMFAQVELTLLFFFFFFFFSPCRRCTISK